MKRKMCFALVMMILGTLVEYYTHFFTDYASVFYGLIGITWGLFGGLGILDRDSGRKHHD